MSENQNKPLYKSMTFIFLMLLLLFNIIGEGRFDFINAYTDDIVNSLLTAGAAYGRWRAKSRIEGIV